MKIKKVINIFGGPGAGKTITAAGLFCLMKLERLDVEYCQEYAKELTFENRFNILLEDQLYIFAKQHRKLYSLRNTFEYIINDSPLLLTLAYYDNDNMIYDKDIFKSFVLDVFNKYPNSNYLLKRNDTCYDPLGRRENLDEAKTMDSRILEILEQNNVKYETVIFGESVFKYIFDMELKNNGHKRTSGKDITT